MKNYKAHKFYKRFKPLKNKVKIGLIKTCVQIYFGQIGIPSSQLTFDHSKPTD